MSNFSELHDEFKEDIALMKGGILFIQSSSKGIRQLREARAHAIDTWPTQVVSVIDSFIIPNRKTENLIYDGAVVLLAASYETYVRDIIEAICGEIESRIPKFDELPEKIKLANARATGHILSRYSNKRYPQFNYLDLSKKLGTCFLGSEEYHLNSGPVSSHDRNLTSSELADLFSRIGIDGFWERVGATVPIQQYFTLTEPAQAQKEAIAKLNEFIILRNQVAHVSSGGSSIGPDALKQWLDFFLAVAESLSVVATEYCNGLVPILPSAPVSTTSIPTPATPAPATPATIPPPGVLDSTGGG